MYNSIFGISWIITRKIKINNIIGVEFIKLIKSFDILILCLTNVSERYDIAECSETEYNLDTMSI